MVQEKYTEKEITQALIVTLCLLNKKLKINDGKLTDRDYEALGKLAGAFEVLKRRKKLNNDNKRKSN